VSKSAEVEEVGAEVAGVAEVAKEAKEMVMVMNCPTCTP
jgi:hypothetical protein